MPNDSPDFDLRVDHLDGATRIVLSGELDIAGAPSLRKAIEEQAAPGNDVIVDIEGLSFIDSSGLHVLVDADQAASTDGFGFAITRGQGPVRRALQLSGLEERLRFTS